LPDVEGKIDMATRRQVTNKLQASIGLWLNEPAARNYAPGLKDRGKRGGVVVCALAHRANRIAHALVRDHPPKKVCIKLGMLLYRVKCLSARDVLRRAFGRAVG
jgi:hypothetical protein